MTTIIESKRTIKLVRHLTLLSIVLATAGCTQRLLHEFDITELQHNVTEDLSSSVPGEASQPFAEEDFFLTMYNAHYYDTHRFNAILCFVNRSESVFEIPSDTIQLFSDDTAEERWVEAETIWRYWKPVGVEPEEFPESVSLNDLGERESVRSIISYDREGHERSKWEPYGKPSFYPNIDRVSIGPNERVTVQASFYIPKIRSGTLVFSVVDVAQDKTLELAYKVNYVKTHKLGHY